MDLHLMVMKRFCLKKVILLFLPLLLVTLSPMELMYCNGAMEDCSPCCPKMMKTGDRFRSLMAIQNLDCCATYQWEGFTFLPAFPFQTDNPIKGKVIQPVLHYSSLIAVTSSTESFIGFPAKSFYTPPPSFILKQSFLI